MRIALLVAVASCSNPAGASQAGAPGPSSSAADLVASAAPTDAAVAPAPSVSEPTPIASVSASAVAVTTPAPRVVLHLGDSMVGGYGGLSKALENKFKDLGARFVRDWQTSVSISTFDHEHTLQDQIAKSSPDVVILTLGANDVFVPFPASLAANVQSIARKMSANHRDCYWMAPPIWKKDTGIVDVIKQNAAPCKVFDASYLKIARAGDGIHPTDRGGADWANAFFDFYKGNGPATPNEPH